MKNQEDKAELPTDKQEKAQQTPNTVDILLSEYNALKAEQLKRISIRDNLVYLTLGAITIIAGVAVNNPKGASSSLQDRILLLSLVIPWITSLLGWTYLMNDIKVSAIGKYIREHLHSKTAELLGRDRDIIFQWEYYHANDINRIERKSLQIFFDCLAFVAPGILSIAFYASVANFPLNAAEWISLILGSGISVVIAWQIAKYANLIPHKKEEIPDVCKKDIAKKAEEHQELDG